MVYFSLLSSKPGRGDAHTYGHKESAGPVHTLYQACDSPKLAMVEVCAKVRSFNANLVVLIKSLSRSQFGREIEQQKVMSL